MMLGKQLFRDCLLEILVDWVRHRVKPTPVPRYRLQDHGYAVAPDADFGALDRECLGQAHELWAT